MGQSTASSILLTVVRSLNFSVDRTEILRDLSSDQWAELLSLTDEAHITLALAHRCRGIMPEIVGDRFDSCLARNVVRHARIVEQHARIDGAMRSRGVEFLVLKGLTHSAFRFGDSHLRPQYDVDLYCPPDSARAAAEAAASLGYEPVWSTDKSADHHPVMIRRTGWRWRGDYYDPDQPLALELHYRFWNPDLGFAVQGADRFWNRRRNGVFDGFELPALHPVDGLTYAAWHTLRHLLGGNLRICHVYELARVLHDSAGDLNFWREWREEGAPSDRLAESIAMRLAREWFACKVNPIVEDYIGALPANVERWLRLFAFSPIGGPNKDELFLNLCLAGNNRDRCRIAARRVFPVRVPVSAPEAHVARRTMRSRSKNVADQAWFMAQRALHHLRTLAPVARSGLRWWLPNRSRLLAARRAPE
jgi:Uncharacterised nucleotidyltransferase